MYKALSPGAVGMHPASLQEAIHLAKSAGFEGIEFNAEEAANLIAQHGLDHVKQMFSESGIKPAGWGLPVEWRKDDATWQQGLEKLPRQAQAAAAIGCDRCYTWVMPCSKEREYDENYQFHVRRFRPIAETLHQHGARLGLEFIGPKTLRESQKYPFIHTMKPMLEL